MTLSFSDFTGVALVWDPFLPAERVQSGLLPLQWDFVIFATSAIFNLSTHCCVVHLCDKLLRHFGKPNHSVFQITVFGAVAAFAGFFLFTCCLHLQQFCLPLALVTISGDLTLAHVACSVRSYHWGRPVSQFDAFEFKRPATYPRIHHAHKRKWAFGSVCLHIYLQTAAHPIASYFVAHTINPTIWYAAITIRNAAAISHSGGRLVVALWLDGWAKDTHRVT